MAALRPGNDEKAWNDPPVFAYTNAQGTPATAAPKRNLLNKRVPFPQDGLKPQNAPSMPGSAPPPSVPAPCAELVKTTEKLGLKEDSTPAGGKEAKEADDSCSAAPSCPPESLKEETLECLDRVALQCSQNMEKRKQDDVKKRLGILKSTWEQEKLSLAVQQRMYNLAQELENGNHEKADALHVSLMVDYVSEVSPWMLGIKHLILAAQSLGEKPPAGDAEAASTESA